MQAQGQQTKEIHVENKTHNKETGFITIFIDHVLLIKSVLCYAIHKHKARWGGGGGEGGTPIYK